MRPFGCLVTILSTLDPLGKFDGKANEGFLVGYSVSSKAFRVFNSRTRIIQETLHLNFLENQPNVAGKNQPNHNAGIQENLDACNVRNETVSAQQYVLLPLWSTGSKDPQNTNADAAFDVKDNATEVHVSLSSSDKPKKNIKKAKREAKGKSPVDLSIRVRVLDYEFEEFSVNGTNRVNAVSAPVTIVGPNSTNSTNSFNVDGPSDNGHTQEEGIDYEEVFAPVARIEAIRLFLAYALFMGFMVYQMDVKSDFIYGTIDKAGFKDPDYPDKVYKVVKALNGLHQAPRACKKKDDGIFISQDKYVAKTLRKFSLTDGKSASTPIDTKKPLLKDPDGDDVDVHICRSMIGLLMYLTLSRPDIMFVVYVCARFHVTLKAPHLHVVKRNFRYLKGMQHLGLWYPKDSLFNLVAYSNSDYVRASLDRKSTTRGCQFLGCRLIYWQCKKQTVVATSSTEAEYVAAASCCAQVLWIQNQLLDYG
nr:hypothetical protein [Tanacetum cinerariifolium]